MISEAIAKQNNEYVEVLEPNDLKLRPIVAGSTSYIDFLERCSRVNNENTILPTFDVAYGLEGLSSWIDKHHGSLHERFSRQFLLELARQ